MFRAVAIVEGMLGSRNVIQTPWWDGWAEQEARWDAGTPLWPASKCTEGASAWDACSSNFQGGCYGLSWGPPWRCWGSSWGAGFVAGVLSSECSETCVKLGGCQQGTQWRHLGEMSRSRGGSKSPPDTRGHHAPPLASLLVSSTKFSSRAAGKEKCSWGPLLYHRVLRCSFSTVKLIPKFNHLDNLGKNF